jgi:hypothetical protein
MTGSKLHGVSTADEGQAASPDHVAVEGLVSEHVERFNSSSGRPRWRAFQQLLLLLLSCYLLLFPP